jgi:hypothetical protein
MTWGRAIDLAGAAAVALYTLQVCVATLQDLYSRSPRRPRLHRWE